MLSVRYAKDGQLGELDLAGTAPNMKINAGDTLELLSFTAQLFPTRRSGRGVMVARVKELPPLPASALDQKVRVCAIVRKWRESGPCYDRKDQFLTEWVPVQPQSWQLDVHLHSWIVADNWDEIRIIIQFRPNSDSTQESEYLVNTIMLEPTEMSKQIKRNVGQNVYMRIFEAFRGDCYCDE